MFDLLKKKISGFVDKLSGKVGEKEAPEKEEAVPGEKAEEVPKEEKVAKKAVSKKAEGKEAPGEGKAPAVKKELKAEVPGKEGKKEAEAPEKPAAKAVKMKKEPVKAKPKAPVPEKEVKAPREEKPKPREEKAEAPPVKKRGLLEKIFGAKEEGIEKVPGKGEVVREREKRAPKKEVEEKPRPAEKKDKPEPAGERVPEKKVGVEEGKKEAKEEEATEEKGELVKERKEKGERREEELKRKVKKGIFASVTETIRGESEVKEEEIVELLEELELGMLESDVALSVAEEIKEDLKARIIGAKVKRGQTAVFVRDSLKEILIGMFEETPGFGLAERLEGEGPHKIMVVGPNGSGKTTTIAKIVNLLKKEGYSVCVAASDTFRAAAVEQLVHHGDKLGVKVIHGTYGSDPTSIAFDALNHAKANDIDVVIIDTAGRQDTNVNLINQLKKMDRVIKPELKIYVGESIAGNAMVEQISTFNNDVGLDGVVLTKLDCDPKGGTVISVSRVAKLPILYVGVGQGYGDLRKFNAEEIVGEILS